MFKITYHDGNHQGMQEFQDVNEFLTLQMREVPALQDNLKVDKLEIDDQVVEFNGSVIDLFNKYND